MELPCLPADWNSYGAGPIAIAAIAAALELLPSVMHHDTPCPHVVPTSTGGVQLEWHTGGLDIEVAVPPSGEVFVAVEDLRTGDEWEGPLPERCAGLAAALAGLALRR